MVGALALSFVLAVAAPMTVFAQDTSGAGAGSEAGADGADGAARPPAGAEEQARALFRQGLDHVENEELAEAVGAFSRSLALVPRVSTALNLALALDSTGQAIEAVTILREIAAERYGPVDQRLEIPGHIERVSAAISTAHVAVSSTGEGATDTVQVLVDGAVAAEMSALGATSFEVNPGAHVIGATATDHEAAREAVTVPRGGRVEVSLQLRQLRDTRPGTLYIESLPDARIDVEGHGSGTGSLRLTLEPREYRVVVTGEEGSDESVVEVPPGRSLRLYLEPPTTSFWESPWLWVTVGVVVAAGVGVAIAVISQTQRAPVDGDVFGNVEALGWSF